MKEQLKPILDNVIIEPIVEETTESGFYLPEDLDSHADPIRKGKVLGVGKGKCSSKTGVLIPSVVKVGDIVLYKNYSFVKYQKEEGHSVQLAITPESNILAILK